MLTVGVFAFICLYGLNISIKTEFIYVSGEITTDGLFLCLEWIVILLKPAFVYQKMSPGTPIV